MENKMNNRIPDEDLADVIGGVARGVQWTQQGMTFYRVARGDTLQDIAERFHTSGETIKALNPGLLKSFDKPFQEGQEIRIS